MTKLTSDLNSAASHPGNGGCGKSWELDYGTSPSDPN